MYCDFFGLRCRPFEDRADTHFYFATPEHDEALATIEYEARYGQGMALLLGEPGTGKTLIVRMLLQRLNTADQIVVLSWPASGQGNLLREACKGFGVSIPSSHQSSRTYGRLRRHLKRTNKLGNRSVLLIDQAQNLTDENLAQLETLTELQQDTETLLSIILVGTARFREFLTRPQYGRILQKLFGERVLPHLTREQTEAYITHRLAIAGAGGQQPFSRDAITLIHDASKGIPRLISRLCDAAMLATYGTGKQTISREIAAEVTSTECGVEHTADASALGLDATPSVVSGRLPDDSDELITPQPARPTLGPRSTEQQRPFHPAEIVAALPTPTESPPPSHPTSKLTEDSTTLASHETDPIASLATPTDSDFTATEELVNRLDRATARAERISTTTEASIAQYTAVERHLATLSSNAERLIGRLTENVGNASGSLEEFERRITTLLERIEEKSNTIDEHEQRASELAGELRSEKQSVADACNEGQRIRSRLTSFADELADKANDVQNRMALLMTGVESSEGAQRNFERLIEKVASVSHDLEARRADAETSVQRSREAMNEIRTEAQRFEEEFVRSSLARCKEQVERQLEQHLNSRKQAIEAVLERASGVAADADRAVDAVTQKLDRAKADADQFQRDFSSRTIDTCRNRLQQQLDAQLRSQDEAVEENLVKHRSTFEKTISAVTDATHTLVDQTEGLEKRRDRLADSLQSLSGRIEAASTDTAKLDDTIGGFESTVEEIVARAQTTESGIRKVVPDMEKLVAEAHGVRVQLETIQHGASTMLLEVGRAMEQMSSLQEQAERTERIGNRLESGRSDCDDTLRRMKEKATSMEDLIHRGEQLESKGVEQSRSLEARLKESRDLLDVLSQSSAIAKSVDQGIGESIRRAEAATEDAGRHRSRLETGLADAEGLSSQLEEVVGSATQIHEALQGIVAHADEKMSRLGSHQAAATQAVRGLSEANVSGHDILERLTVSLSQSEKMADRLSEFTTVVEAARDAETTITASRGEAQATLERLGEANENAERRLAALAEIEGPLNEITAQSIQTQESAEQIMDRLVAHISAAEKSADVREPLLREFVEQARSVGGSVTELDSRCTKIEERFEEMTRKPAEIIATAQAQASQLERVCSAVRKIFSGLSQASLEAKNHISECRTMNEDASSHLAQLTAETDRAANTLHEWVQEAVRVQLRLETTLQRAPSIRETHPADSLRRMSSLTAPIGRMSAASNVGDLTLLPRPHSAKPEAATGGVTTVEPSSPSSARSRTEEVAQLIDDAKRSAKVPTK